MDGRIIQGLYGIADLGYRADLPLRLKIEAFLAGGASVVQVRAKERPARELLAAARLALELAAGRALVIVNDRPDVAMVAGADGVHVGAEDLPVAEVRRIVGPQMIVGATARTLVEARAALAAGADYVGFGPVFPTSTKELAVEARGLPMLAEVVRGLGAPVVAIGGITLERAEEVARAGAAAVAVVSDVLGATHPADRARLFAEAVARGQSQAEPREVS
ncbi:MAG TPA: thiamine phosphate synthase [Myxococcales bacterium]|jgi:thiamine-phosphate pyrophosphorylase